MEGGGLQLRLTGCLFFFIINFSLSLPGRSRCDLRQNVRSKRGSVLIDVLQINQAHTRAGARTTAHVLHDFLNGSPQVALTNGLVCNFRMSECI